MPLLAWGAYSPDTSDYEGTAVHDILNVIPRGDGYGPFPDFSTFTQTLPGMCRGGFFALKSDGSVAIFAATSTKLYALNNTTFGWTDVSKSAGSYSTVSSNANWDFAQFGNFVIAVQANVVPQAFNLASSTAFADLGGSPPQAAYVNIVNQFALLSGLQSTPYRIVWSGLGDVNSSDAWTAGINSSDFQDFEDGGLVRGVAGGDQSAIIFQDQAIRQMSYVAGSPLIFQIAKLTEDKGLYAPYSIVKAGEVVYFYAGQGFHKIVPGGVPEQIGRERVDRTFLTNLDRGNLQLFMGAADPRSSRVYWAYKSNSGATGLYDQILGYDPVLDRFFPVAMSGQYLLGISQTGVTLESLDAIAPGVLTITGAANNGSGLIRLALADTSSLTTGQIKAISGLVGTTEANGNWKITVINSTHIDLQGSTFTHTYVSGGIIGGSLDAMILSLDAYATAVQPEISQFGTTNALGFFRGANLEATLESSEQGTDGNTITVKGFRPITDATTLFGSASNRMTQQASAVSGPEVSISARTGRCDTKIVSTRYSRFKARIPAGTNWTFTAGVEPDVVQGGAL